MKNAMIGTREKMYEKVLQIRSISSSVDEIRLILKSLAPSYPRLEGDGSMMATRPISQFKVGEVT